MDKTDQELNVIKSNQVQKLSSEIRPHTSLLGNSKGAMSQLPDSGPRRDYGTMSASAGETQSEVDTLCSSVGSSIQEIKNNSAAIEKACKVIGTPRNNVQYRDNACDLQKRTNEIIDSATSNLGQLTRLVRGDSKQRRLQVDKLTTDFQCMIQKYSESQQRLVTKLRKTLLVAEFDLTNEPENNSNSQLMQQQQLQYPLQVEDAYDRENQMREIESVVVDVNVIMLKLASQITEQGHHIATIESNIENVEGNVEQGASELQKAATYQNKYRKKVLILLLIAIIVGVIVTAVVVSDVGKK